MSNTDSLRDLDWTDFEKTGSIHAYLKYKGVIPHSKGSEKNTDKYNSGSLGSSDKSGNSVNSSNSNNERGAREGENVGFY